MPNFERIFLPMLLPNQICKQKSYCKKDQFSPSVFQRSVTKFMSHIDVCGCIVLCSVAGLTASCTLEVHVQTFKLTFCVRIRCSETAIPDSVFKFPGKFWR
jgi:hypothetical protein